MASALVLVLVVATAGRGRADERVDITAMDGVQLIGDLAGSSGPGVVFTPGERRDRGVWEAVASAVAARGFRTLRFDLRGQGDSTGTVDAAASDRDVEGAFRYLLGRKIRPVFLVGEGVGGAAVLSVARRVPVAGLVVLGSPPADAVAGLAVPSLLLTNAGDQDAKTLGGDGLEALIKFLSTPK